MKGIFFTIITFLIFLGMITYITVITNSNIQKSNLINERISANRIYYTWKSVSDNIKYILNVYVAKINDTLEINDTLPANESGMIDFLKMYQQFINQTYRDPTIDIRFEDSAGKEVILNETTLDPKTLFTIKPMNINYGYPDYGKNELFVKSSPQNFSFIKNLDLFLSMKNVYFNCNYTVTTGPDRCNKWSPDNHVPSCTGVQYCLNLNLTFKDADGNVFNFPEKYFDIGSKKSEANLDVKNATAAFFIKIKVGSLTGDQEVLHIFLQNVQTNTSTEIQFNTTDFYINLASILNVSTLFGKKVGNI